MHPLQAMNQPTDTAFTTQDLNDIHIMCTPYALSDQRSEVLGLRGAIAGTDEYEGIVRDRAGWLNANLPPRDTSNTGAIEVILNINDCSESDNIYSC